MAMIAKKDIKKLRTWIEVDTKALAHNFRLFRKFVGAQVKLMAIVKSNAYGHGLVETSQILTKLGTDWLGVDSMTEALTLRKAGIKTPTLVLGHTLAAYFDEAAKHKITLTVSQAETTKELLVWSKKSAKNKLDVHLKVDTGMHRQGFFLSDFELALKLLDGSKGIKITGLYSHLASPGNDAFLSATNDQAEKFEAFRAIVATQGLKVVCHLTATGGTMGFPAYHYDLCRIGLGLYGLWPTEELRQKHSGQFSLKPALTWKTRVSEIKELTETGRIGYDFTQEIKAGTRLAIAPIGYWHGFPRHLSGRGEVVAKNRVLPVLGRVSMDMIAIDASAAPDLKVGDELILIGLGISAAKVAELADSSKYEIVTRLNPLIWRIYK